MTVASDSRDQAIQNLLDRESIRDVLARYCRGMDRVWPDLIASVYHEPSRDYHGSFAGSGHDFACDSEPARKRQTDVNVMNHHLLGQSLIDIEGDTAECETYFLNAQVRKDDDGQRMSLLAGRYLDRLERVDGEWMIRARRCVADASVDAPLGPPWPPMENYTRGARWPDDPVFHFDEMVSRPDA